MQDSEFYLDALGGGQNLLLLLQVPGDDHGHADRIFLEPVLERERVYIQSLSPDWTEHHAQSKVPRPDLQVPLDLADVVLQQEVVLQGEAAVLVVQLSQQVVEANGGQRVLKGDRVPEEAEDRTTDYRSNTVFCSSHVLTHFELIFTAIHSKSLNQNTVNHLYFYTVLCSLHFSWYSTYFLLHNCRCHLSRSLHPCCVQECRIFWFWQNILAANVVFLVPF